MPLTLGPLQIVRKGHAVWHLETPLRTTRFHLLDWSDIVEGRMTAPLWSVLAEACAGLGRGLWEGVFGKVRRRDRAMWLMMLVGFAPVGLSLMAWLAAGVTASWGIALVAGAVSFGTIMTLVAGPRSPVRYVLDIAWGARRIAAGDAPELEVRVGAFEQAVRDAEATGGEVIVAGHSLGAALAVKVAASMSRGALLTIGQSIPLVSLQKTASAHRRAMEDIAVTWIDISAGRDVLGFDGYDPSGGKARCHRARFLRAFDPDAIRAGRFRGYDMHFQYFMANKTPDQPWDWFDILLGDTPLPERFADQPVMDGRGTRRLPV